MSVLKILESVGPNRKKLGGREYTPAETSLLAEYLNQYLTENRDGDNVSRVVRGFLQMGYSEAKAVDDEVMLYKLGSYSYVRLSKTELADGYFRNVDDVDARPLPILNGIIVEDVVDIPKEETPTVTADSPSVPVDWSDEAVLSKESAPVVEEEPLPLEPPDIHVEKEYVEEEPVTMSDEAARSAASLEVERRVAYAHKVGARNASLITAELLKPLLNYPANVPAEVILQTSKNYCEMVSNELVSAWRSLLADGILPKLDGNNREHGLFLLQLDYATQVKLIDTMSNGERFADAMLHHPCLLNVDKITEALQIGKSVNFLRMALPAVDKTLDGEKGKKVDNATEMPTGAPTGYSSENTEVLRIPEFMAGTSKSRMHLAGTLPALYVLPESVMAAMRADSAPAGIEEQLYSTLLAISPYGALYIKSLMVPDILKDAGLAKEILSTKELSALSGLLTRCEEKRKLYPQYKMEVPENLEWQELMQLKPSKGSPAASIMLLCLAGRNELLGQAMRDIHSDECFSLGYINNPTVPLETLNRDILKYGKLNEISYGAMANYLNRWDVYAVCLLAEAKVPGHEVLVKGVMDVFEVAGGAEYNMRRRMTLSAPPRVVGPGMPGDACNTVMAFAQEHREKLQALSIAEKDVSDLKVLHQSNLADYERALTFAGKRLPYVPQKRWLRANDFGMNNFDIQRIQKNADIVEKKIQGSGEALAFNEAVVVELRDCISKAPLPIDALQEILNASYSRPAVPLKLRTVVRAIAPKVEAKVEVKPEKEKEVESKESRKWETGTDEVPNRRRR